MGLMGKAGGWDHVPFSIESYRFRNDPKIFAFYTENRHVQLWLVALQSELFLVDL
jgi:hypothetical protein